ncbi:MAG: M20/M25/M40 family metallo-hydrolase [Gemmatimonadaceae bacterium]|nr:M20/M25/M40 family metallo-hydrolase [Gemmatimonadaceae bacterium]
MLDARAITFLKQLLDTPGPSGYEGRAAAAWRAEAATFADEVTQDALGNSFAVVNPTGAPTVMLAGHIDEIGVIVTHIDDQGFVYIAAIGGWDPQVLVGQRLRFATRTGEVLGVVGKKPIHVMKAEEKEKASKLTDLWVDIGAVNGADARARIEVGDAGVIDARTLDFPNDRIVSRSIDDRIGAFVVLEALRRYAASPGAARVVAVATTQEEIGYQGGGALPGAVRVAPAMAIVVDVGFATDHPQIEKKEHGEATIGGGPVFSRGSVVSPIAYGIVRAAAEHLNIPFTLHAAGLYTSTDADAVHHAHEGVATALLSVPNRYMHSPNEMVSLVDLDRSAAVIAEACRAVDRTTDFTAR